MPEPEKPLNVLVAEALGCKPVNGYLDEWRCVCKDVFYGEHTSEQVHTGHCHSASGLNCGDELARYDTDWAATGPLILKYGITIRSPWDPEPVGGDMWEAAAERGETSFAASGSQKRGDAEPVLAAICRLILKLHAAGKLEP